MIVPGKRVLKAIVGFHVWLYRTSGGRLGTTIKGSPVCLVTMRGRKSGREITLPLMYTPLGDKVLLAKGGGIELMQALGNTRAGLPFTAAIDRRGEIVAIKLGAMNRSELDAAAEAALK